MIILTIFYFIKNKIRPIELPKYNWQDNMISYNLRDNISHIKFYATKNWCEIYVKDSVWFDSKNNQFTESLIPRYNNQTVSLIVPKWKIKDYGFKKEATLISDEGKKTKKTIYILKDHKLMLNVRYNKLESPKKYNGFPIVDFIQVHSADDEDGDRWSPVVDFSQINNKNRIDKSKLGKKI